MAEPPNPVAQSPSVQIRHVGVVGAGTTGHGIAQVLVRSGYEVVLHDSAGAALESGAQKVARGLSRDVEKGRLTEQERQQALKRLNTSTIIGPLSRVDLVIEAVSEQFEVKAGVFHAAEAVCGSETIFASNTSSISITRLAAATRRPSRFVGLHFFNPVPVMKLVEVVPGLQTSAGIVTEMEAFATSLGKIPVRVSDFPGFISNRVLMPMINEAIYALMEGVATGEAIDTVMKLGMNHPMGPLELADFIGLDVCLDIMKVLYEGFRDPKYRPCPLLEKMVSAGWLGRKTSRGFYEYAG